MTRRVHVELDVLLPDDADVDRLLVGFAAVVDEFGGGVVSAEAGTIDIWRVLDTAAFSTITQVSHVMGGDT